MLWLILLLLLIFLGTFIYGGLSGGAPWVPSRGRDLARFLKAADFKPGQKFYDLGAGDGRLVAAAARAGADAVGFEVALLPYLLAIVRGWLLPRQLKYTMRYKNFWSANLGDADVVYIFLIARIYPKLKIKLEREAKPGAKIVAYVWPFPGWTPTLIDRTPERPALYVYQMPARA